MAIALAQNKTGTALGASSLAITPTSAVASGNTLIATIENVSGASVSSVVDSIGNPWIRAAQCFNGSLATEIWFARGTYAGSTTVTLSLSGSASVTANVSEFSGAWFVDPLDQWGANYDTSNAPIPPTMNPRVAGELVVANTCSSASVTFIPATSLSSNQLIGSSAVYTVLSTTGSYSLNWGTASVAPYASCIATFRPGESGLNPRLQFPETLVQISTFPNYLAPLAKQAMTPWVWTNISSYVRSFDLGPLGRQHELDRVQASSATIMVDNRTGVFNTWNTSSFLNGGVDFSLNVMIPVSVVTSWYGVVYPKFYGYVRDIQPTLSDVLNTDATISCVDLFQAFALKTISGKNYAQQILSNGPSAYYRMGDSIGSTNVLDSSGNGNTMSLVNGSLGLPLYGASGAIIYDATTSVDFSGGTNLVNGGITNVDNSVVPPVVVEPLNSAAWSFETWVQYTGAANGVTSAPYEFAASPTSAASISGTGYDFVVTTADSLVIGEQALIVGSGFETPTYVVTPSPPVGGFVVYQVDRPITFSNNNPINAKAYPASFTLFSGTNGSGKTFDIRIGANYDFGNILGQSVFPQPAIVYRNRLFVGFYFTLSGIDYISPDAISGDHSLLDGAWHHVVVTESSNVISLYVDGVLDSSFATGGGTYTYHNPTLLSIGSDIVADAPTDRPLLGVPINGLPGKMQDVALYQRALSADEVAADYAVGTWFASTEIGAANGDATAGRLNKVLTVMGLDPATVLNVPFPFVTELYAENSSLTTTSALTYIQTQGETEPGLIFQNVDGEFYAYNRQYQYLNPSSASTQAIYGDSASVTYHYDGPSFQISSDDLDVWNDVQTQSARTGGVLQEWGPAQSAAASVSDAYYGPRTMQGLTSLQQQNDLDALALAQNYIAWYASPVRRVSQIMQSSATNGGANISQMLGRGLMDRVTVQYQGQTPGPQFSQDSVIEQITDSVQLDSGPEWITTWALSPYEILMEPIVLGTYHFSASASVGVLTL